VTQTELNETAHRFAIGGLAQIAKWAIAQQQARELQEKVERLDQNIKAQRATMATINTEAQREVVGAVTAMGGQVIPAYGGAGRSRLLRLEEMRIELDQLEESRRVAQVEMDGFLAIPRPGPDVIPGLAEWITAHLIDRPDYRFKS
jgi:hypothetical protein